MTFSTQQIAMLQAPLDPKHVVKPSGNFGPKGDYIEGWHAINELNRVFGFDGWSYTISLSRDALTEGQDSKGNTQWQAAYTCICTLTVQSETGHVVRQAVGFGSGFSKQIGDAIEGATKEAETDALKRAARTFGNIFGLALYDKSRANVQTPAPSGPINGTTKTWVESLLTKHGKSALDLNKHFGTASLNDLTYEMMQAVKAWIEEPQKETANA